MSGETQLSPQQQTLYLLGLLSGQMESLQASVDASNAARTAADAQHRAALEQMGIRVGAAEGRISVLEAQKKPAAPWWSVVAGVTGVITGLGSLITLLALVARIPT